MEFYSHSKNERLLIENRKSFDEYISRYKEGTDFLIDIKPVDEIKSFRQLKLAYACFRRLSDHTGYSVEECKTLVKMHQGLCAEHTIEGKTIFFCVSLSEMTRKELSEFIVKMNDWSGNKLGLSLLEFDDIKFLNNV